MNSRKTKGWVATYGMLIGLAFIFSYLEAIIPIPIPIPGVKLGLANLVTICFGECVNFPLQRNVTFKSHGPLGVQIAAHGIATIGVFLVMNLFTSVWNPVTNALITNAALRNTLQSIVTAVVTGGVAMIIIFAVDKTIFADGTAKKA